MQRCIYKPILTEPQPDAINGVTVTVAVPALPLGTKMQSAHRSRAPFTFCSGCTMTAALHADC